MAAHEDVMEDVSDGRGGVAISNKVVNLHRDENINEDYLKRVNPKGLVPTLTGGGLTEPLPESLAISYWLSSHYPRLLPEAREKDIRQLLSGIHSIQGVCLSVEKGTRMENVPCDADEPLQRTDLSPEYRQALEYKQRIHRETLETALTEARVTEAESQARTLLENISQIYSNEDNWIFGEDPTMLDGHLVPFLVRLIDFQRQDLIPENLQKYAKRHAASSQWKRVMHGRPTRWNVSLGHVSDMAAEYSGPQ